MSTRKKTGNDKKSRNKLTYKEMYENLLEDFKNKNKELDRLKYDFEQTSAEFTSVVIENMKLEKELKKHRNFEFKKFDSFDEFYDSIDECAECVDIVMIDDSGHLFSVEKMKKRFHKKTAIRYVEIYVNNEKYKVNIDNFDNIKDNLYSFRYVWI